MKKSEAFTAGVAKRFHIPGNYFKFAEVPGGFVSAAFFYRGQELYEDLTDVVAGWSTRPGRLQQLPGFDEVLITSTLTQQVSFYIMRGEVDSDPAQGDALTTFGAPVGADKITANGNAFMGSCISGPGGAGQFSRAQLFNPNGSGKILYVDAITNHDSVASSFYVHVAAGGAFVTLETNIKSRKITGAGGTNGTGEVRRDTTAGAPGSREFGVYSSVVGGTGSPVPVTFSPPITLAANTGLNVQAGGSNTTMTTTFFCREY